jgi:limonene 1,2-monooxygenase
MRRPKRGMKFGIFMAPFHRLGENPTLAMDRGLELIQWIDHLGFDEAWIGEHHSAGWETIASPEIFMGVAADPTKHIMLGSGVTSLPYHNPFMVAQRFVQLDHMSKGRVMMGCGPGALTSDAYMLNIDPVTQRERMNESLDTIIALLKCEEPVSVKTDWFELRNARLHLAPYSDPRFHIATASTITPFGMMAAGRHGLSVLSIGAGIPGGPEMLAKQWQIAEDTAKDHGHTMNRKDWRVVVTMHLAEDAEQALREVHHGERAETVTYFEETLGRPPGRSDEPLRDGVKMGTTLVGSPETAIKGIRKLLELSEGDFGGVLFRAHEWANREQTMRSYELFARHVAPRFQGSLDTLYGSNEFTKTNRIEVVGRNVEAVRRAFTDVGREVPEGFEQRTLGARDLGSENVDKPKSKKKSKKP